MGWVLAYLALGLLLVGIGAMVGPMVQDRFPEFWEAHIAGDDPRYW